LADKNPDSGDDPYEPPNSEIRASKPLKQETPLWARRTILDWYSSLGTRGRLIYFGGILVAFNGVTWCFGAYFPKMLCVGGACLVIGLVISSD